MMLEGVSEIIYEGYIFDMEMEGMVNIGGLEFTLQESLEINEEQYFQYPIQINAVLAEDGMYEAHDLMIELEGSDNFIDLIHDEEIEHQELEFIEGGQWEGRPTTKQKLSALMNLNWKSIIMKPTNMAVILTTKMSCILMKLPT